MILRDPVHGLVSFEADELSFVPRLMQTPEVQRLRRIRQLGLTSFAYPDTQTGVGPRSAARRSE